MNYDKTLIDSTGEEFPYSESIGSDGYYYKISIVFDDKDGELHILNPGTHIEFDDGSMLDFNIAPEKLFPNQDQLSEDDLIRLMGFLCSDKTEKIRVLYSKEKVEQIYGQYQDHLKTKSNQSIDPIVTTPVESGKAQSTQGHA